MSAIKSTIFRVTGLPNGPEERIISSLKEALHQHASASELQRLGKITIAASCYDAHTSVALLEWKGDTPDFLYRLVTSPFSSWEVELDDADISFDRHFLGFTQLYNTIPERPIHADIIAVPGLDGHAYGSFRGKGNLGRMWLRDFLSKDLPNCRTMIYGYNSKLSSRGIDSVLDYSRGFMEAVKKIRRSTESMQRPLFFIAHSFGGIIVAQSLIKAALMDEDGEELISSLYKATYGILFFGTPHKGLVVANIEKMIAEDDNHPRSALLKDIEEKSSLLLSRLSDFKNVIRGRKIVSFYEQSQTRSLVKDEDTQSWSRSGGYATAVGVESAVLQLPDSMETKIPLSLDHSQLVKFDHRNEEGYKSALYYLAEFEKSASRVVTTRFLQRHTIIKASSTVPFRKDPEFVGRRDIMTALDAKFSSFSSHMRVALVGLGGMGKSQIAIEYSYRVRLKSPETWVFWVYASTMTRFEQSYRDTANVLKLPGSDDPQVDVLQLLSRWLADEGNGPWLLILDNADDANMFSYAIPQPANQQKLDSFKQPLLAYIPQTTNGSILVTSRNTDSAYKLTGDHRCIIQVGPLDTSEGLSLLKTKLTDEHPVAISQELLTALDHIPLAITQAAAFISKGAPRMNISRYLDLFNESEGNRSNLLDIDAGDLRRDAEVPNAVITTWQISFNQVRRENPFAADVLSLMSVLNRQDIPQHLLLKENDNRILLETALTLLLGFSLIIAESGGDSFAMHRLVQLATKKWLESHSEIVKWNQEALHLLLGAFPDNDYQRWKLCEALFPHIEAVLSCSFNSETDLLDKASLLHGLSRYLWKKGDYQLARSKVEQALVIRKRFLHKTNEDLLEATGFYGTVLDSQGKYDEAESIHREVLQLWEDTFGQTHPSMLTSMNNLALALLNQEKCSEAEVIYRKTLKLKEEALGEKHLSTLITMNNLAESLSDQGKFDEAIVIHRQVLQAREELLSQKHPDTLASMNNLAVVFDRQGMHEEAEAMYRQILELQQELLGQKHPDTLTIMGNLAGILGRQGKHDEAEAMHQEELQLCEEVLGEEHPSTLTSRDNLAVVFCSQGKYNEAEKIYRQTLQIKKEWFGEKHLLTIKSIKHLAKMLQKEGRYDDACIYFQEAIAGFKEVLGEDHFITLACQKDFSLLLEEIEFSEDANLEG